MSVKQVLCQLECHFTVVRTMHLFVWTLLSYMVLNCLHCQILYVTTFVRTFEEDFVHDILQHRVNLANGTWQTGAARLHASIIG